MKHNKHAFLGLVLQEKFKFANAVPMHCFFMLFGWLSAVYVMFPACILSFHISDLAQS